MPLILAHIAAFIIGLSRGGLKGVAPLFILLMASAYGGKASTGIVVPLLLIGDVLALYYYWKYIQKRYVVALLPWVLIGVLSGVWVGQQLSELAFKKGLAVLVLISLLVMCIWDLYLKKKVHAGTILTAFTGLGAGLFSMLGNFAGAFANIYFLMTRLPKRELIGTATFVFFLVNVIKVPFHIYSWKTISVETLQIDLYFLPAMIIGFFAGWKIIDYVSDQWFRQFLYVVTILGTVLVLFQ